MLKDLGILVKVGQHANIAGIIGVCEEPGKKLKRILIRSNILNGFTPRNADDRHGTLQYNSKGISAE